MLWCDPLLILCVVLSITGIVSSQQCQEVSAGFNLIDGTVPPVNYTGIKPNGFQCFFAGTNPACGSESVLGNEDIGPTHSVDVGDRDQIRRFFVWHRDNGTVTLQFSVGADDTFDVSYIDIYTLSIPSARIGSPTISFSTNTVRFQRCSFSSSDNTLSRNTFTVSQTNIQHLNITFQLTNQDIDWLFISEIQLCTGDPPSSISCGPPTDPPTPTSPPSSPPSSPPTPRAPTITLSSSPPTEVTPDLRQPDSVSLTCSVAIPLTDDYQYRWQWLTSGTLLPSDSRFTITHTTNTRSSSLQISGLQYSDAGEYMCRVNYTMCPEEVDCSGSTPVTGSIQLDLPVVVEVEGPGTVYTDEVSKVTLSCKIYGYPRDPSPPVWTFSERTSDELQSGRFNTAVTDVRPLNGSSISTTERVVSQLTIRNVTEGDSGEYTCSVQGNSTTVTLDIITGSPPGKQNSGMIAGVVIAVLLLVIALTATLIVIVWMIWRYRRNGKLDSCDMVSCCTCSCWSTCARVKNISIPLKRRHYPNANGSSAKPRFRDDDVEVQVYSSVQKPARGVDSPPPLPPQTLTEMELDDLMNPDYVESPSPTHEKPSRRNTALSVYSQSGATPKLVKVSKLKKFKMKENPIYLSSDEIEAGDCDEKLDDAVYALPSKKTASHSNSIRSDASEPIYSEAINPTMFTKRASTLVTDDNLHPYGPVYARPLMQKSRQPLEIEEENIREIKQIGVGQFGAVILAEMSGLKSSDVNLLPQDVVSEDGVTLVAVKRLKLDVSNEIRQSFDKEIKFMSQLEHENIVQLLAVCMQRDNPFIVMEYMENGDLNQFLQRYQIVNDDAALHLNQIPSSVLQYMAIQIASGMCYLASLNYVHRDLATRNCLVGSNFRIKISDFGMSRNLYERVYYRVRGRAMLPIRWMATESFYGRFSEKSDVWAYGVAVWEIFTLGKKQPYEELDDQEMIQDAIRGTGRRILKKPEGCPQDVYKVLLRCWEYAAEDRTTFKDIRDSLLSIQQDS